MYKILKAYYEEKGIAIYNGDSLKILKEIPDESVNCCITSPPYWGLRDYGTAKWEGGDEKCAHRYEKSMPSEKSTVGQRSNRQYHHAYKDVCGLCGATRKDAQLGLEKTPEEYIAKIVEVFKEVKRVLKKEGTCWLNLGDSYAGGVGVFEYWTGNEKQSTNRGSAVKASPVPNGLKPKDLIGIPWRVAFALQADGWYLRQDIVWSKPNSMPESVSGSRWEKHRIKIKSGGKTGKVIGGVEHWNSGGKNLRQTEYKDCPGCSVCLPNDGYVLRMSAGRCTKSHEYVFLLTKNPKYYFDYIAIQEPAAYDGRKDTVMKGSSKYANGNFLQKSSAYSLHAREHERWQRGEDGKYLRNKRSVWTITTKPFKGAHFATFPPNLVEPMIKAGTSDKGICPDCGKTWVRVVDKDWTKQKQSPKTQAQDIEGSPMYRGGHHNDGLPYKGETKTIGWKPICKCGKDPIPATVMDIFCGSGTTGIVAKKLNRNFIGIDIKSEYCKMAGKGLINTQGSLF